MSPVSRGTPSGDAYLALRRLAIQEGKQTDHYFSLYALEGFLARLMSSDYAEQLVLKGGFLLSAYGIRRPTRDIDFAGIETSNDINVVKNIVSSIMACEIDNPDGLFFDQDELNAGLIREDSRYSGVRVGTTVHLDRARIRFHVDVNVGDPVWPEPDYIELPSLLGNRNLSVLGYPIEMVLSEKIATAIDRKEKNTRWRDYGDIWMLIRHHDVDYEILVKSLETVTRYRGTHLAQFSDKIQEYAISNQRRWEIWRSRGFSYLPESFLEVCLDVWDFISPLVDENKECTHWDRTKHDWL